jgi:uncharacterized protein involved in outer membrane biogenesis
MVTRRQRIALVTAAWIAGLAVLIAVLGFLVAPPIARPYLEKAAGEALGRPVSVESLQLNPFLLSARLRGIAVASPESKDPALSVEEVRADLAWSSLLRLAPVVSELRVVAPRLRVARLDANRYDWSDVIDRLLAKPAGEPALFSLTSLSVERGEIDFDDRPEKKKHAVRELRLAVPFVSSFPAFAKQDVEPSFSAQVNGTELRLSGKTRPFDASRQTALSVDVDRLDLVRYADYVPLPLKAKLATGAVQGRVELGFAEDKGKPSTLRLGGKLAFADIDLRHASGERLVSVAALELDIASFDLIGRVLVVRQVRAQGADIRLGRDAKGNLSVASLVDVPAGRPEATGPPFVFEAAEVELAGSRMTFIDQAAETPFKWVAEDLSASAKNLSNRDDRKAEVQASFKTASAEAASAEAAISLAPVSAQGKFELKGFGLSRYAPYYSALLGAEIGEGSLSASGAFSYAASTAEKPGEFRFADISARLADLRMTRQKGELVRLAELQISGGQLDLERRTVSVASIAARKGAVSVARDASGAVNLGQLGGAPSGGTSGGTPWTVNVGKVAVEGVDIAWEDGALPVPAKIALGTLSVSAEGLSTQRGARGKATVTLTSGQGRVSLSGPLQLDPLAATLQVEARDFGIVPFQPYLGGLMNVGLRNGAIGATGTLTLEGAAVSYSGDATLGGFAAVAQPGGEELLGWKSLDLRGVKAKAEPFSLDIAELALAGFFSRLVLSPDGRFNLQDLLVRKDGDSKPATPAESRPVNIAKVTLAEGTIDFTDRFVKPNYSAHLTGVSGSVTGLSGKPGTRAEIALKAALEGAPVEIAGSINPLAGDLALDVKANVRGYDLNLLSPYAAKYVGYGIERGKLSFDVHYRVENRTLNATNRVVLNQLVFGAPVESPDAIKAPVLLAVRLLQNSRGEIDVELPITGSLDDPQFSMGGIVVRMVGNLILRAVTAPFALLGSLFGGGGEELSWVEFEPGQSSITGAAKAKIDSLAKALADRPALTLEIAGRSDEKADAEALKRGAAQSKPPTQVGEQQLRDLASRRAAAVRDLLSKSGVAGERMYLANPRRSEGEGRERASPSRVDLYLH